MPGCRCCCVSPLLVTVSDSCTGAPLAGVTVAATQGTATVTGVTDAGGLATLTIKGSGLWNVSATLATYTTGTSTVTIVCNETASKTMALSKSAGTTTLTVTTADNCTSVPLSGTSIAATQGATTVTGTTNAFGAVSLTLPRGGSWSVAASRTGYTAQTKTVTVTCWTTTTASFALAATSDNTRITVTVQGCSAVALVGALVTITRGTFSFSGTTNGSGQVVWTNAPVGSWTATASKAGFNLGTTTGNSTCNSNSIGTISMPVASGYHCLGTGCADPATDTLHANDPIAGLVPLTWKSSDPDWNWLFGTGAVWSGTASISVTNLADGHCGNRTSGTWPLYFAIRQSDGAFYFWGWVCWLNANPSGTVGPTAVPAVAPPNLSNDRDGRIDPSSGARRTVSPTGCPATGVTYSMPAETFTPGGSAFLAGTSGLEGRYGTGALTWTVST